MITLYVIMLVGAFVVKKRMVSDEGVASLSRLVINVTMPCAIVSGITGYSDTGKDEVVTTFLIFAVAAALLTLLSFLVVWALATPKGQRPFYRFIAVFGNVAFIGIPMGIAIVGEQSVFYASILVMLFNGLFFTYGLYLLGRGSQPKKERTAILKGLLNPCSIAAALGIALFLLQVPIPEFINQPLSMMGSVSSVLAMLVVGAVDTKVKFKEMVNDYRSLIISVCKMAVFPIALAYLLKLIGLIGTGAMASVVLVGMPLSTSSVIFAHAYNQERAVQTSQTAVLSTLLLLVTTPALIWAVSIVG